MSIFNKKTTNFAFCSEAKWAQKVKKCRKKWKFHEKFVKKLLSVYEWYLLFCVIQRREITKNEEKRVFVWVVWSIILKIVSYNPKTECCHYMQISKKKQMWKKTTNLFLRMKSDVFFWKNTVFVTNLRDIIPKKDVKN